MVHQCPLIQTPSPPPYTNKIDRGFSFEVEGPAPVLQPSQRTTVQKPAFRLVRLALPDLDPGHYGRCSQVSTRCSAIENQNRYAQSSLRVEWRTDLLRKW